MNCSINIDWCVHPESRPPRHTNVLETRFDEPPTGMAGAECDVEHPAGDHSHDAYGTRGRAHRAASRLTGGVDRLLLPAGDRRRQPLHDPRDIQPGDIRTDCDAEDVARLLTSLYLGVRQTSNLYDANQFIGSYETVLLLALAGFTDPDRLAYFTAFVRRRSALAIRNAAPLGATKL